MRYFVIWLTQYILVLPWINFYKKYLSNWHTNMVAWLSKVDIMVVPRRPTNLISYCGHQRQQKIFLLHTHTHSLTGLFFFSVIEEEICYFSNGSHNVMVTCVCLSHDLLLALNDVMWFYADRTSQYVNSVEVFIQENINTGNSEIFTSSNKPFSFH